MRIVIGGAYNGKRNFVKEYVKKQPVGQVDVYEGELPEESISPSRYVVIGRFEKIVEKYLSLSEDEIVSTVVHRLKEIDAKVELICICTDIGRGIVPLDPRERKVRDSCGRLYQQLFSMSDSVCRIWYGIPQVLKGEKWQ